MRLNKVYIAVIIALALITSMFTISTFAVGSESFIVFGNDSSYQYASCETWQEFIDYFNYTEFTYDEEYVYYNGLKLWSMPDNTDYVTPTDTIYSTYYGLEDYDGFLIDGVVDEEGDDITFFCGTGSTWSDLISNTASGLCPDQGFTCDETFVYYEGTVIAGAAPEDTIIHVNIYSLCEDHEVEDLSDHDVTLYCYHEGCLSCGYVNSQAHDFVYDGVSAQCRLCGYYYEEQHIKVVYGDTEYYFTFDELGIDDSTNKWSDVAANFNGTEELGDNLFVIAEDDVIMLYTDKYGDSTYHTAYTLSYEDGSLVYSSDEISNQDTFYLNIAEVTHDMIDVVDTDDDTYCYYQRCSVCGYEIFQKHDYIQISLEKGLCTEEGTETLECHNVGCGHVLTETVPARTHVFDSGVVIEAPTCTDTGIREYTCRECEYSYQATISALGHELDFWGTCKRDGCNYNFIFNRDNEASDDNSDENNSNWLENLFGGGSSDSSDGDYLSDKLENLFDDFNSTLDKLLAVALTVLGVVGVIISAPYVIKFLKALFK